jgi:hypothetical protein
MAIAIVFFVAAALCVIASLVSGVRFWFQDRQRVDNDRVWWAAVFLIFAVVLGFLGFVITQI